MNTVIFLKNLKIYDKLGNPYSTTDVVNIEEVGYEEDFDLLNRNEEEDLEKYKNLNMEYDFEEGSDNETLGDGGKGGIVNNMSLKISDSIFN